MSHATLLFYSNGMITHHWKRGVDKLPLTPLFAYTLSKKKEIKKKMNKDGLYQHHCSLELKFRKEKKREERDKIRLHVCSKTCLSKSPCVF